MIDERPIRKRFLRYVQLQNKIIFACLCSIAYAQKKNALFVDDLHNLRGFHIAIDADLLLSLVDKSNVL